MKKITLIFLMVLLTSSLFAYQGKSGVGVELYSSTDKNEFADTKNTELELKILGSFMLESMEIAPYIVFNNEKEKTAGVLTDKYSEWGFGSMFNVHVIKTEVITLGTGIDASMRFGKWDEDFNADNSTFKFNAQIPIILDLSLGSVVFRVTQPVAGYIYSSYESLGTKASDSIFYVSNGFGPKFGILLTF